MRPTDSIPPESPVQPVSPIPEKDKSTLRAFAFYLKDYFRIVPLRSLSFTVLFVSLLVTLNYTIGIESRIRALRPWTSSLACFFLFYGFVFFSAWAIQSATSKPAPLPSDKRSFLFFLLIAPLYFAFKMIRWDLSFLLPAGWHYPWNRYTLTLLQLPSKLILLLLMLAVLRKFGIFTARGNNDPACIRENIPEQAGFSPLPYLLILLFLAPLVALASTQPDFLHAYPKFRSIAFIGAYTHPVWPWRLLYELSYGLDFVSIELFFRGFLVIGLSRWAGPKAILPMAAFYCTVHFGKPLGECISSFAGGLALGVIAWRTRSILGGLMVHLGLAWMMEIGGWLGNPLPG